MKIERLAIIGSRSFSDYEKLCEVMVTFFLDSRDGYGIKEIVSGSCPSGADQLAVKFSREHAIRLTEFKPDWNKYGKAAGPIRNEEIVKYADCILACWDSVSRGTASTLAIAKRLKKPTIVIYF